MSTKVEQKDRSYITKICFAAIFAGVIIIFACLNQNFFTPNNFLTILKHVSVVAIAALGLTFVISVGHTDISFYLIACFSAMLMSWLIQLGFGAIPAILIGLAGAVAFGVASGIAVGVAKLPDIIITIAIGSIAFGCAYLFSEGMKIYDNFKTSGISFLNDGSVGGIPTPVFLMIVLFAVCYLILERTKIGTFFYATGSNSVAARFSGINVTLIIVSAFVICVVLASFAGMVNTASKGNGEVKTAFTFLMPCYTAVFIGNAIFKRPCVLGTFLGALLVQILSNGFTIINLPYYIGDLVTSTMLIVALLISVINVSGGGKQKRIKGCAPKKQHSMEGSVGQ